MGKRVDNDSTMEVSTSQLVQDNPDNDASVWKQVVVGTEQFAPPAPQPTQNNRAALLVFIGFVVFAAVVVAVVMLVM